MRAAPPTPPAMAELAGGELEFFDGMIQRCIEIEQPHREVGPAQGAGLLTSYLFSG